MKIGLVRHFKVDIKRNRFMTAKEYNEYQYNYDRAGVIKNELVVDKEWDKCYCSSMERAVITAKTIYHGEIILTDKLVEIPSAAHFDFDIKLPYHFWALLGRLAWVFNSVTQPENSKNTKKRIREVLDIVLQEENKNILIVSHAGTMYELRKMLLSIGFKGKKFLKANNGMLYVYEKIDK
jgi:broad specificity phosphatase PhoE